MTDTDVLRFPMPAAAEAALARPLGLAVRRGLRGRCPACGEGRLFHAYLKVVDRCAACGEDLSHQRADDAPPYVTMLIVGHLVVAGVLAAEEFWPDSSLLVDSIVWVTIAALASLLLLPRIKGGLVGYQWALRMHGFGGAADDPA